MKLENLRTRFTIKCTQTWHIIRKFLKISRLHKSHRSRYELPAFSHILFMIHHKDSLNDLWWDCIKDPQT